MVDKLVKELIESKQYKSASKQLKTKLKRSPDDPTLLSLLAQVHYAAGESEECHRLCVQLSSRSNPVTDIDTISDIYRIFCKLKWRDCHYQDGGAATNLWVKPFAAAANISQKRIYAQTWATLAIRYHQWGHLQNAASALSLCASDKFEKRKFYFWQITAYYMASLLPSISTQTTLQMDEKNQAADLKNSLHRRRAVENLEKAIKASPMTIDDDDSHPHNIIAGSSELHLLVAVFAHQNRTTEMIKYLVTHPRMRDIALSDQDFSIVMEELYEDQESTMAIWRWAYSTIRRLRDAGTWYLVDNWRYWYHLVGARSSLVRSGKGGGEDYQPDEEAEILVLDEPYKVRDRNEMCHEINVATLELIRSCRAGGGALARAPELALWKMEHDEERPLAESAEERREAFIAHFVSLLTKPLPHTNVTEFMKAGSILKTRDWIYIRYRIQHHVLAISRNPESKVKWLTAEMNSLEIDCLHLEQVIFDAKRPLIPEHAKLVLEAFVCNCLRLYKVGQCRPTTPPAKSVDPSDRACLLAVWALFLLYKRFKDGLYLLQATCLLSFVVSESTYNSDARLELVYLAKWFGLTSVAWRAFEGLDVKRVLCDSMAPSLFNRIAIQHPFPSRSVDAEKAMEGPLRFYTDAVSQIPDFQEMALDHEHYVQVLQIKDFGDHLRHSATRIMMVYERRRMDRLRGKSHHRDLFHDTFNEMDYIKAEEARLRRDSEKPTMLYYPQIKEQRPQLCELHDKLSKKSLDWMIGIDAVFEVAIAPLQDSSAAVQSGLDIFIVAYERLESAVVKGPPPGLSPSQIRVLLTANVIAQICTAIRGEINMMDLEEFLPLLATTLVVIFDNGVVGSGNRPMQYHGVFPGSRWLEEIYLNLEVCQVCFELMQTCLPLIEQKATPKVRAILKKTATDVQRLVKERFQYLKDKASEAKARLADLLEGDDAIVREVMGLHISQINGIGKNAKKSIGQEIFELMGYQNVRKTLFDFVDSAQSTLDGVFHAKLK